MDILHYWTTGDENKNFKKSQSWGVMSCTGWVCIYLIHALTFITAHLDYCNGVLFGVPSKVSSGRKAPYKLMLLVYH